MTSAPDARQRLCRKRVSFTGRLASMTHTEAEELVAAHGGKVTATPGRNTDFLVVGQEGWPLRRDGNCTQKLLKAQTLREDGCEIKILSEESFLQRLELNDRGGHIHRLYTTAQLTRILGIPRDRIRRWVRAGLIEPSRTVHRLSFFDLRQVSGVHALWRLAQAGVPLSRIRRSPVSYTHLTLPTPPYV